MQKLIYFYKNMENFYKVIDFLKAKISFNSYELK